MKRGWLVIGMALALATAVVPQQTEMTAAAKALMSMLEPEQLKKIQLPFDSDERFNWYYIPRERQGLPLKQMTERQRTAAFLLLHVGLSPKGYNKAESIRSLEIVLHEIEHVAERLSEEDDRGGDQRHAQRRVAASDETHAGCSIKMSAARSGAFLHATALSQ